METREMGAGAHRLARYMDRNLREAVTYLEVMVAIGVVSLLLATLLPSLNQARERIRRTHCANNLRQWGIALRIYRDENFNYLPAEGTYLGSTKPDKGINKPDTWFNQLPPILGIPAYSDVERKGKLIVDFPEMHVWLCPSKLLTPAYKSQSGQNQFHYGMNQVLDGLGSAPDGSKDTPGFYDGYYYGTDDKGGIPINARLFRDKPETVFMFDICGNSMAGTQRNVATKYQRGWDGSSLGKFHGNYANILHLDGRVARCTIDDLVTGHDHYRGEMVWTNPDLYWGWTPPVE